MVILGCVRHVFQRTTFVNDSQSTKRTPLWRKAIWLWLIATVVGWIVSGRLVPSEFSFAELNIGKSLLYLGLLTGLAIVPALNRYWKQTHPSESFFLAAFLLFLMIGQSAGESRKTFPFVEWNMYNKPAQQNDVVIIEYVGVRADGSQQVLTPGQVFPALGRGTLRFQNLLDLLVKGGLTRAEGEAKTEFLNRLDATLLAMMDEYNRRFPEQALVDVEVHLSNVDLPLGSSELHRTVSYSRKQRTATN